MAETAKPQKIWSLETAQGWAEAEGWNLSNENIAEGLMARWIVQTWTRPIEEDRSAVVEVLWIEKPGSRPVFEHGIWAGRDSDGRPSRGEIKAMSGVGKTRVYLSMEKAFDQA